MNKFKVGQNVVCNNNCNGKNFITVGKSYVVQDVVASNGEDWIGVVNDDWYNYFYNTKYFDAVEESKEFVNNPQYTINVTDNMTSIEIKGKASIVVLKSMSLDEIQAVIDLLK